MRAMQHSASTHIMLRRGSSPAGGIAIATEERTEDAPVSELRHQDSSGSLLSLKSPQFPDESEYNSESYPPSMEVPASVVMSSGTAARSNPDHGDDDDATLQRSGSRVDRKKRKSSKKSGGSMEEQLNEARTQLSEEKAAKRKLFKSLVKLANELRRIRAESVPLIEQQKFAEKNWYEGGMWRAPLLLPSVPGSRTVSSFSRRRQVRESISLSDLFFDLVIITAFTRVGVIISEKGSMDKNTFLYFAVFWNVWMKESSYSTRFDTTDLSAQLVTLVTCFAVLFASLSVQALIATDDANRIMIMAAFVALLHCLLHIRVALHAKVIAKKWNSTKGSSSSCPTLHEDVTKYAVFNVIMTALEAIVWLVGLFAVPSDWEYRWSLFAGAVVLGLRIPRVFLGNDFHGACAKRAVLFILLLGFLLQSIVVAASDFFRYRTPTLENYAFIGAACLMLFCIKLLYVDDVSIMEEDHALIVSPWTGFLFNLGHFTLQLATTVMGSGLNLLTHSYLAATAALPGPEKDLVCGGFSIVILSTLIIKSMHLKRIPAEPRSRSLFVAAFMIQSLVILAVVAITSAMCFTNAKGFSLPGLEYIMQNDIELLCTLSCLALFVVLISWLDEGVELALYSSADDSDAFRVLPFGFWCCLRRSAGTNGESRAENGEDEQMQEEQNLTALRPLLGGSVANLGATMAAQSYQSMDPYQSMPMDEGGIVV